LIEELMSVNEELEQFAYVASHDLQEPLRMVTNFAQLLGQRYSGKLDAKAEEYLGILIEAATRMQALVSDLLEYARLGKEAERYVSVNCQAEVVHVLENLQETINKQGAKITYDPLPTIKGNPIRFMRLLQNLIGNGLKYQESGHTSKIHIGCKNQDANWLFFVQDNGIGIRQEYLQKIFIPFKRLHTKEEYKGAGMGLAICKKIVQSFGGTIWAESTPGKGSIFFFTVPKNL
jgi:light-regulated signal transduction histidine kinase (bacteriophytochrome)